MNNIENNIIMDNQNQITSYEVDTGLIKIGYIFENKSKKITLNEKNIT